MPPKRPDPERLLRRLEWTVLRPLDGLLLGNYHTMFQGAGLDFSGLRPYEPGDDVRHIDWAATARKDAIQIRRFHEDREIDAWFLVDTSPSLDFGTGKLKSELVYEAVGTLAALLTRQGNRVGGCVYSGGLPRLFPPSRGRDSVLALLRGIVEPSEPSGETDLRVPLDAMAGVLRRRSLIFLVSDFAAVPGWEDVLGRLAVRHEVLAVAVADPTESQLPAMGIIRMQDAETGQQLWVDTNDRGFRRRLEAAQREREEALEQAFRLSRADVLRLSTDGDLVKDLWGFAHRRKLRKTVRGGAA